MKRLIAVLIAIYAQAGYGAGKAEPKYEHFMLGVYICSSETVLTVPIEKVFTDFATHGIEIVSMNTRNYFPLAQEQRFNRYAKANGVQIFLQMYVPEPVDGNYSDEYFRKFIGAQIEAVNKLADSNAVVGWSVSDEIEDPYLSGENPEARRSKAEENLRRFITIARELDKSRRIVTNHDHLPWMTVGEDEPMCSTGYTTRFNSHKVKERIAEAQKQGYASYFLVSQASRVPMGTDNLRWYGYHAPITDAVVESQSIAQDVQDHAEVAYLEGATGVMYFLYWAGGANYLPYSLTDINGDDYQGKWDGVRKAAQNIRRWEGAPSCRITSPESMTWITLGTADKNVWWVKEAVVIEAATEAPKNDPVRAIYAEYSLDGCMTWKAITDANMTTGKFVIGQKELPKTGKCLIRARAINSKGPSLWDVVEVKIQ